jgi:hypothetical protein
MWLSHNATEGHAQSTHYYNTAHLVEEVCQRHLTNARRQAANVHAPRMPAQLQRLRRRLRILQRSEPSHLRNTRQLRCNHLLTTRSSSSPAA